MDAMGNGIHRETNNLDLLVGWLKKWHKSPNGGSMVIYHGRVRKKITLNKSKKMKETDQAMKKNTFPSFWG